MSSRLKTGSLAVLLVLLTACSGGSSDAPVVRVVQIDAGTEAVMAVGGVNVVARPGDTIRITHANTGPEGREAAEAGTAGTVTHALVAAPADALPPIFLEGQGGAVPNGGIWGACRGGTPAQAAAGCPMPPIEGPAGWDGQTYWSLGAMLPTESRELVLADDIPVGTHRLVCALHPTLFVDVIVSDDEVANDPAQGIAPLPSTRDSVLPADAADGHVLVGPGDGRTQLNEFWPATVEVAAGQEVTWTTAGRAPHDVVLGSPEPPELVHSDPTDATPLLPDGVWPGDTLIRSGYLSTDPSGPGGTSFAVSFAEPGTYAYYCRFHPTMTGSVTVS